jgi:hypothetical protein
VTYLPAEPLRRLIRADLDRVEGDRDACLPQARIRWPGLSLLADQVKINQRRLRYILNEQDAVSLSVADQYCLATGRLLADVYPELYETQQGAWVDECRHCGGVYFDIAAEGAHRMFVRCRECGRRKAIEDRPGKRTGSRPDQWAMAPGDVHDAVQLYQSGLSVQAVGDRLGVCHTTVLRYLVLYGIPRRERKIAPEAQRRGRVTAAVKAWPQRRLAVWLRARGLTYRRIAQQLGSNESSISATVWRARQCPVSVRYCTGLGCPERGRPYPVPPPEVLARRPDLEACPVCSHVGQGEGDWWQLTA